MLETTEKLTDNFQIYLYTILYNDIIINSAEVSSDIQRGDTRDFQSTDR